MGGAVFTPKQRNWRAYADGAGPTAALANENVKPTLPDNTSIVRLRISIAETGGKASNNAITILEYSINQTDWFSLGAAAHWDYADGVDVNGNTITSLLLTDSSTSGRYCELASSTVTYALSVVTEWDAAIVPTANVSAETTYYFRTVIAGTAAPLDTAETYPQVLAAAAALPERTTNLGVTLAGAVCVAAATIVVTAALAVQLAGATVGSGATAPVVSNLGKTLAGVTLSSDVTTGSGRIADLSAALAGAAISSGVTAPVAGVASIQLVESSLISEGVGMVKADLSAVMEGAALSAAATAPTVVNVGITLAGASIQSGVTVPVKVNAAIQLANASITSAVMTGAGRMVDLSVVLESVTLVATAGGNGGFPVLYIGTAGFLSTYDDDEYPARQGYLRGKKQKQA